MDNDPYVDALAEQIHTLICCAHWEVSTDQYTVSIDYSTHPDPDHAQIDRLRAGHILRNLPAALTGVTNAPLLAPREHHGPCLPNCVLTAPHTPPCCLVPPVPS